MLDQRRKRWVDVVQMVYKCFVFAGELAVHTTRNIMHPILFKFWASLVDNELTLTQQWVNVSWEADREVGVGFRFIVWMGTADARRVRQRTGITHFMSDPIHFCVPESLVTGISRRA